MKDLKPAIVVSVAAIAIAVLFCVTFLNRARADDVLVVTGLGRLDFSSDLISWKASFKKFDANLVRGYERLERDKQLVLKFLSSREVKGGEITFEPVSMEEVYVSERNEYGNEVDRKLSGYELVQGFRVDSREVEKIGRTSREVTDLIRSGVEVSSEQPDYFFSGLADLKVNLIALATQDARTRAERIVEQAGAKLGKVRFANLGVFQIIGLNESPEATSWEGAFDTKSREKTATITVKLEFELR